MTENKVFIAATEKILSRAEFVDGAWKVEKFLEGMRVNCLVSDPVQPQKVFAGTQNDGILVSGDSGKTWENLGMAGIPVKSLAIDPHHTGRIYAGCKPVSLYVSQNGGETWEEYEALRRARRWWWFSPTEPPDWSPYVMALTISPTDPDVIMAGIELGGVLRSEDGGRTWSKHRRGAERDCHSLRFHPSNGNWIYQGGGGGPALSQDGGLTWRKPKDGIGTKYGWMVAADPQRPEVWYFSASNMPKLWRGEFEPPAHKDGQANAHIYRSVGGAPWEQLSGGLSDPLDYMAYALVTDQNAPGHLYAGLANGDVWHTENYGDIWKRLPFNLGGIHHTMIMI
jgi:photosystem II stability/assembly factor-like uncharacterized protein